MNITFRNAKGESLLLIGKVSNQYMFSYPGENPVFYASLPEACHFAYNALCLKLSPSGTPLNVEYSTTFPPFSTTMDSARALVPFWLGLL